MNSTDNVILKRVKLSINQKIQETILINTQFKLKMEFSKSSDFCNEEAFVIKSKER